MADEIYFDQETPCVVDFDTRTVFIPDKYKKMAVAGDSITNIVTFKTPLKWRKFKLSETGHVNGVVWVAPDGAKDTSQLTLAHFDDKFAYFTWSIPPEATLESGVLEAALYFSSVKSVVENGVPLNKPNEKLKTLVFTTDIGESLDETERVPSTITDETVEEWIERVIGTMLPKDYAEIVGKIKMLEESFVVTDPSKSTDVTKLRLIPSANGVEVPDMDDFNRLSETVEEIESDINAMRDGWITPEYTSFIIGESKPEIVVCWGDGLTMGAGVGSGNYDIKSYPAVLSSLIDKEVRNYGVGGETTATICARQGALPMFVQPFNIPSTITSVPVTLKSITLDSVDPLLQMPLIEKGLNPCVIDGVEGSLSYANSQYYFTRSEEGTAVNVERPVIVETRAMRELKDYNQIICIWVGQNDSSMITTADISLRDFANKIKSAIHSVIDYANTDRYIVICSPINSQVSKYNVIYNELLFEFGEHCIDVANYLIEYGLEDEGITPTETDINNIADRRIPSSLKYDGVHLNIAGYDSVAKLVHKRGQYLGYW